MTDKTTTQNLTRTTAGDDPKRMADYLQALATDADQRMAAQFYDLQRSVEPPFACLRLTTPVQVDANVIDPGAPFTGSIPFDTVDGDTAGLVDLSASPYVINLTETGWWWCGGYAFASGFGGSPADMAVTVHANGMSLADPRHDALFGPFGAGLGGAVRVTSLATVQPAALSIGWNGASASSVT